MIDRLKVEDITEYNATKAFEPLVEQANGFFSPISSPTIAEIYDASTRDEYANAMILGMPGVGKSFLIRQLVALFSYGIAPDYIKQELNLGNPHMEFAEKALIGNCDFINVNLELLGQNSGAAGEPPSDSETRMKKTLNALVNVAKKEYKRSGRRQIFLFDEVATLPAFVQESLKKILDQTGLKDAEDETGKKTDVGVHVWAFTTNDEYVKLVKGDSAIQRRYKISVIHEPSEEQALDILINRSDKLKRKFKGIEIDIDALVYVISVRNMLSSPPLAMPASILSAVDDLYAWFARTQAQKSGKLISLRDAQTFMMKRIGLGEVWLPGPNGEPPFYDLERLMKEQILGQDDAIRQVAKSLKAWARLGFAGEPPVILLAGPSGNGKNTFFRVLNQLLYGNTGEHMLFPVGGKKGFGIDALLTGPPAGNHRDTKLPLLVERMEGGHPRAMIGLDEGKDLGAEDWLKLKDMLDTMTIKPEGADNRTRVIAVPTIIMGQWTEEHFVGLKTEEEITARFNSLTQAEIDNAIMHPDTKDGVGAVPRAVLQRVKRSGAVVMIKPVLKSNYTNIARLDVTKYKKIQKRKNNLDIEVTPRAVEFMAQFTIALGEDARGLGATVKDFAHIALSESGDYGIPMRNARILIDARDGMIVVASVGPQGQVLKEKAWDPRALTSMKVVCETNLAAIPPRK